MPGASASEHPHQSQTQPAHTQAPYNLLPQVSLDSRGRFVMDVEVDLWLHACVHVNVRVERCVHVHMYIYKRERDISLITLCIILPHYCSCTLKIHCPILPIK